MDGTIKTILGLYSMVGSSDYIGEPTSITGHSEQAGEGARLHCQKKGYEDEELILGSLFHDIGHILGLADKARGIDVPWMGLCGAIDHENIGADYLLK